MDEVTWAALTFTLTALLAVGSWLAYQRRGITAGLKGAGLTLLPAAAYLTDTLRMFTRIITAIGDWAAGLVFSPTVWLGVVLAGIGVLLFGAGRAIESRRNPTPVDTTGAGSRVTPDASRGKLGAGSSTSTSARGRSTSAPKAGADDELDEIEALLRKRGIT